MTEMLLTYFFLIEHNYEIQRLQYGKIYTVYEKYSLKWNEFQSKLN